MYKLKHDSPGISHNEKQNNVKYIVSVIIISVAEKSGDVFESIKSFFMIFTMINVTDKPFTETSFVFDVQLSSRFMVIPLSS